MTAQQMQAGNYQHDVVWDGVLTVDPHELDQAIRNGWLEWGVDGWEIERSSDGTMLFLPQHNLVVDSGITRVQNLGWGIGGVTQVVNCMGVDNGTANPVAGDTTQGTGSGPATSIRLQAFDSTATQSSKVITQISTYSQATVSFIMKRLSLSFVASGSLPVTTVASIPANSLHSMTNVFTIDLTGFTTWSQSFTATITGTGS